MCVCVLVAFYSTSLVTASVLQILLYKYLNSGIRKVYQNIFEPNKAVQFDFYLLFFF